MELEELRRLVIQFQKRQMGLSAILQQYGLENVRSL